MRFIPHPSYNSSVKIVAPLVGVFMLFAALSGCGDALVSQMPQTISAGGEHACGLRENGDAVCWGWNHDGQATDVAGEDFVTISAGSYHTCGLRENGTGMCWGAYSISLDGPYTAISAGVGVAGICAPECWGRPAELPDGISLSTISVGSSHVCGVRENGDAVCWGDNSYGKATPPPGRFAQPSAASQ